MKLKVKKEELGIAVAMAGLFGAILGLSISLLLPGNFGFFLVQLSIPIGIIGILINFWIVSQKK